MAAALAAMEALAARAVPLLAAMEALARAALVRIHWPGSFAHPRQVVPRTPFESSQSSCCVVRAVVWARASPYIETLAVQERKALLDILEAAAETRREDRHPRLAERAT